MELNSVTLPSELAEQIRVGIQSKVAKVLGFSPEVEVKPSAVISRGSEIWVDAKFLFKGLIEIQLTVDIDHEPAQNDDERGYWEYVVAADVTAYLDEATTSECVSVLSYQSEVSCWDKWPGDAIVGCTQDQLEDIAAGCAELAEEYKSVIAGHCLPEKAAQVEAQIRENDA